MDIIKEIGKNKSVLVVMPGEDYNDVVTSVAKKLSKKRVCYVTLNKTVNALKESFKKKRINTDNFLFIDAISKTIKEEPDQMEGCYFVSSPGSLTELSILISRVIRHNFDYIIFDSLTNMLIYEKKAPVIKFISSIINKIRESNTKSVLYSLDVDQHSEVIQQTTMFVDKVIDLNKKRVKKN